MSGVLITGANGHLGQRLIASLRGGGYVRAAVRSPRAAQQLAQFEGLDVVQVDYTDVESMKRAVEGMEVVIHLVGILKAGAGNSYETAHEQTCATLCAALHGRAKKARVVYVSILGSNPESSNACLRSKGAAEEILLRTLPNTTVLQVPMVLGEGDYAAQSLHKRAHSGVSFGFRMSSLEQPIYAGDVVDALLKAGETPFGRLLLAGPESLTRAELAQRAAQIVGRQTRTVSLPLGLGMALAGFFERVSANPPVTRAMLEVLDHDDAIDPTDAANALGLSLTSLDEMLRKTLVSAVPDSDTEG